MSMSTHPRRFRRAPAARMPAALALIALSLTGCEQIDPLTRPYSWVPENANAHNIAAMAVRPSDLTVGRHVEKRAARDASLAAERLAAGKAKSLGGGGGDSGGGGGGGSGGGGGATPPGGGS